MELFKIWFKKKKEWIKNIPSLWIFITALTVSATVIYETAYYQTLGIDIWGFLSLSDYVASALQMINKIMRFILLVVILISFVCLFIAVPIVIDFIFRLDWVVSLNKKIQRSAKQRAKKRAKKRNRDEKKEFRSRFWSMLKNSLLLIVLDISWLLFSESGGTFPFLTLLAIYSFLAWPVKEYLGEDYTGVHFLIILFPSMCLLVSMLGVMEARSDLGKTNGEYHLTIRSKAVDRDVQILRGLSTGLVVRYPKKDKVVFITWEKIDQFELKRGRLNRPSLMCRWYGYFCFPSEKDEGAKKLIPKK